MYVYICVISADTAVSMYRHIHAYRYVCTLSFHMYMYVYICIELYIHVFFVHARTGISTRAYTYAGTYT